jgi:hypothetical protein
MIFDIKNLTLLSLWGNQLKEISPEIRLLSRLQVLGVGRNRLRCLPSEISRLPRLKRLHCRPNPFATPPKIDDALVSSAAKHGVVCSLMELCARQIAYMPISSAVNNSLIGPPEHWQELISVAQRRNQCAQCQGLFVLEPYKEIITLAEVGGEPEVPLNHRLCSASCFVRFAEKEKRRQQHQQ